MIGPGPGKSFAPDPLKFRVKVSQKLLTGYVLVRCIGKILLKKSSNSFNFEMVIFTPYKKAMFDRPIKGINIKRLE